MSDRVVFFRGFVSDDGRLTLDWPRQFRQDVRVLAGYEVEGELRRRRSKRSGEQNRYLHVVIKPLADELGYTTEELKLVLLGETFGYREVRGANIPMRLHTSDLNTQEFAQLIERLLQVAAEAGVVILLPDEWRAARRAA